MLEDAGIIRVDGDIVSLADNWLEALEDQRRLGKEIEAEELAERRYKIKSRAYHRRHETSKSEPSAVSIAGVKLSREKRHAYLDAHAGYPAADTPSDAELVARRQRVERLVREGMARRFAEQEVNGAVARRSQARARSDPPSGPPDAAGRSRRKMPRMVEGVYVHGQECGCEWCAA